MSNKQNDEYFERLHGLEQDMEDYQKSWKEAELELIEAKEWRDKKALDYANSAVKYYNYKNNEF